MLLHGKFQPPSFNGVAVHKRHPEGQTKMGLSNICLDSATILIKMWLVNYCNNSLIRSKVGSIFKGAVVAIAPLKKALMHRMV